MAEETYNKNRPDERHVELLSELDALTDLLNDLQARMRSDQRVLRDSSATLARAA